MTKKQISIYLEEEEKNFLMKLGAYMHKKNDLPSELSYIGRILLDKGVKKFLNENKITREDVLNSVNVGGRKRK